MKDTGAHIDDIFSITDSFSLARSSFPEQVDLRKHDLFCFNPSKDYHHEVLCIPEGKGVIDYIGVLKDICKSFSGVSVNLSGKWLSALYEAVRNAHQHGNNFDPAKKIDIFYLDEPNRGELVVADEGGILNGNFIPFILYNRMRPKEALSFYNFAPNATQCDENSGIGTFTIHYSADEVRYFKNEKGGLSVQMIFFKPNCPGT